MPSPPTSAITERISLVCDVDRQALLPDRHVLPPCQVDDYSGLAAGGATQNRTVVAVNEPAYAAPTITEVQR